MMTKTAYFVVDANEINPLMVTELCSRVANNLCEIDAYEISQAVSVNPSDAVMHSVENAEHLYLVMAQGDSMPLAVAGIGNDPEIAGKGWPWMLSTEGLANHPKCLLWASKMVLPDIMKKYQYLENYVHVSNRPMQKLLHRSGFHVEPPSPWGMYGRPFCRFSWSNPNVS